MLSKYVTQAQGRDESSSINEQPERQTLCNPQKPMSWTRAASRPARGTWSSSGNPQPERGESKPGPSGVPLEDIDGDSLGDQAGVYGTKGETDPSNIPGARYYAASWVDPQGNFWLFGGYGNNYYHTLRYLCDLWKGQRQQ